MPAKSTVAVAAFLAALPQPDDAHDIYSGLKDERGESCCDDRDCRPVPYRFTPSGLKMFVAGRWIDVHAPDIQFHAFPDDVMGVGHWCGAIYDNYEPDLDPVYTTRCAILPPNSASGK